MDATTTDKTKFDGKWLVFERSTANLFFKDKPQDTKKYLTVGMVWGGEVAGKPVAHWLREIEKNKKEA